MAQLILIGAIVKTHGLVGAVVVRTDAGQESCLDYVSKVWLGRTESSALEHEVIDARWMPKGWKVTIANLATIEMAQAAVGQKVFVDRQSLDKTDEGEFYISDLAGLAAVSESGETLGRFVHAEPSAHASLPDNWWFELRGKEIPVPSTKAFIKKVDLKGKQIILLRWEELLRNS